MIEIYKAFLSITSALAGGRETTDDSLSYKLYKYVRDNLKNEISLDFLSERFGYCKNYIIKLFKREFGQTPYEYVTSRRIDFAKSLLISSELSLSQIAAESGFVTYINFYKTFIKTEKCSPGDFRRSKINTV